jgi:hypothetical protein
LKTPSSTYIYLGLFFLCLFVVLGLAIWSSHSYSLQPPSPAPVPTLTPTPTPLPTTQPVDPRAQALTAFFIAHNCPPINYQLIPDYLAAADQYQIDYRLLPALSYQESTCAQHYPAASNNIWGWNSARTGFASLQSGINYISNQLANGHYYANKTTDQKLRAYNHHPDYPSEVEQLMKEISNE